MDITTILTFFAKDALCWNKIEFQDTFTKAVLRFLEPFRALLDSKFAKSAYMTPKLSCTIIPYGKQKTQNLTLISNLLKKLGEKVTGKVIGLISFAHSTKRWKTTKFVHFYVNNFSCVEAFLWRQHLLCVYSEGASVLHFGTHPLLPLQHEPALQAQGCLPYLPGSYKV